MRDLALGGAEPGRRLVTNWTFAPFFLDARHDNTNVLWGGLGRGRRVVVACLLFFALADVALAFVFLRGDSTAAAQVAQPLHPVAGSFVPDERRVSECTDPRCFQQAFGNIAYRDGPKDALALVETVYGNGSDPACHRVTHMIGAASLARFGGDVTKTLAAGDPTCWSGYYHGVLERSLVKREVAQGGRSGAGRTNALHG